MASRKLTALIFLAVLGAVFLPMAHAEDSIWSGLVLATNEEHPKQTPPELEKYYSKLKGIFGYNQFELLGQHMELMDSSIEHWLIPRKDFFMHVDSQKSAKPGFYRIKLDLWQDIDEEKKLIAQIEARISGQNSMFIRGPYYGKGQIVIILMVK